MGDSEFKPKWVLQGGKAENCNGRTLANVICNDVINKWTVQGSWTQETGNVLTRLDLHYCMEQSKVVKTVNSQNLFNS